MKNKLLGMTGIALMIAFATSCSKPQGAQETAPAVPAPAPVAAPAPTPPPPPPAPTTAPEATAPAPAPMGDQISMLDHLKGVNKVSCEVMVKETPTKTQADCEAEMNKMSELNPQNATIMISKAKSDACLNMLRGAMAAELLTKSTEGECSLATLQTP